MTADACRWGHTRFRRRRNARGYLCRVCLDCDADNKRAKRRARRAVPR